MNKDKKIKEIFEYSIKCMVEDFIIEQKKLINAYADEKDIIRAVKYVESSSEILEDFAFFQINTGAKSMLKKLHEENS